MKILDVNLPHSGNFTRRSKTDMVVVHHAAARTASVETINDWHNGNGWNGIGYHYYIRKDGSVYRGRPEWALGAHAQGSNDRSIGVCCEGDYMKETTMPAAQLKSLKALLRDIMGRYGKLMLKRHREVCSTDCPGDYFPWAEALNYEQYEPKEQEDEDMTAAEVKKLIEDSRKVYRTIEEAPDWAKATVKKLVDRKCLNGTGAGLELTEEMLRLLVVCDRAGAYDG